jgi:hypothetical protein
MNTTPNPFDKFFAEAEKNSNYWNELTHLYFTENILLLVDNLKDRAEISKLLEEKDKNLTLTQMVELAFLFGKKLEIKLVDIK